MEKSLGQQEMKLINVERRHRLECVSEPDRCFLGFSDRSRMQDLSENAKRRVVSQGAQNQGSKECLPLPLFQKIRKGIVSIISTRDRVGDLRIGQTGQVKQCRECGGFVGRGEIRQNSWNKVCKLRIGQQRGVVAQVPASATLPVLGEPFFGQCHGEVPISQQRDNLINTTTLDLGDILMKYSNQWHIDEEIGNRTERLAV